MQELGTINAMPGGLGNTRTSSTFIKPVIMFLNFTDNLFFFSGPQFEANLHIWWMRDYDYNRGVWEGLTNKVYFNGLGK